ncbi:hypothetical protein PMN64_18645 [Bradyrhizobium sp. UFLA01-814]|uniref:hypothetical protein n=1 Tax=Bradyrhizobium sp. UFLA01-814 TaxID=3023480 RepID=UPI00398B9110
MWLLFERLTPLRQRRWRAKRPPRVEFGPQQFDFVLDQPHGTAAEQQMRWWISFSIACAAFFGIANLPATHFHAALADRIDDSVIVRDRRYVFAQGELGIAGPFA